MKTIRFLPALVPALLLGLTPLSACSSPTPTSATTETRLTSIESELAKLNQRLASPTSAPSASGSSAASTVNSGEPSALKELRVSPDPVKVKPGEQVKLESVLMVTNADEITVAKNFNLFGISSSDTSIATVSADGQITGVKTGTTLVTITLGKVSKTVGVIVDGTAATPTPAATATPTPSPTATASTGIKSLSVSPTTYSIVVNATAFVETIIVTLDNDDTGILNNREAVVWSSADSSIATINQSGVISAIGVGTTTITVTYKGVSTSFNVTVTSTSTT
jgi:hypothetical protein